MDEEKNGFPIPAKKPMFGDEGDVAIEARPMPQSDFIMSFANDDGTKAVVLTSVETVGGEVLERHGREELEGYAKNLLETGDDPFELQIGRVFEGETAVDDAQVEAFRLDEMFNPGDDATDAELAAAVDDARVDAGMTEDEDTFPEDLGVLPEAPMPELDLTEEDIGEEPEVEGEEPMLDQLKKKKAK